MTEKVSAEVKVLTNVQGFCEYLELFLRKRDDHEVHDIADGRYDGRIQKFQQGISR